MAKVAKGKRILSFFAVFVFLFSLFSVGLQAAAATETHTVITISNTSPGTDINPLIRFYAKQSAGFTNGETFTVRFEWKIDDFKRMSTENKAQALVDYYSLNASDEEGAEETAAKIRLTKGTDGWVDAVGADGKYITFHEIICNDMGNMQKYGILNIGLLYAKGTLSIRNFRILDSKGNVVYSLDDDPDVNALMEYADKEGLANCSLKDIGLINPEPLVLATGFGDNTASVIVSKSTDTVATTTTTAGLVFEDDPTTQTPSSQTAAPPVTEAPTTAEETTGTTDTTDTTNTTDSTTDTGGSTDTTQATTTRSTAADPAGVVNGDEPEDKGGLPVGAIIAIVAAAVVVIAAGVVAVLAYTGKINLPFFHKADGDSGDSETKK